MLLLIAACLPDLQAPDEQEPGRPIWSDSDALQQDSDDSGPTLHDADGDGHFAEQGDCNDGDATVYPGAPDICDGRDQDCDDQVDEDAVGDVYEPNDSTAHSLGALSNSSVVIEATLTDEDDVDRFSVDIEDWYWVGPSITVRLGDIGANSDYALTLYGPDGAVLSVVNEKGAGRAEKLHWEGDITQQESGTYVVEVFSAGGADCMRPYTLEVSED